MQPSNILFGIFPNLQYFTSNAMSQPICRPEPPVRSLRWETVSSSKGRSRKHRLLPESTFLHRPPTRIVTKERWLLSDQASSTRMVPSTPPRWRPETPSSSRNTAVPKLRWGRTRCFFSVKTTFLENLINLYILQQNGGETECHPDGKYTY